MDIQTGTNDQRRTQIQQDRRCPAPQVQELTSAGKPIRNLLFLHQPENRG